MCNTDTMFNVKRYSDNAVRRMRDHRSHLHARAQSTVEEYVERVCNDYRGELMSAASWANVLITISIFPRDFYEQICIDAAHTFKRKVIDGEFINMGKYVDDGEAWLPLAYTFLGPEDQASLRAVARFGADSAGNPNVNREAVRVSAQNIYVMLDQLHPLKRRLELQAKVKKIMCGIQRTIV
tara:strand:- start:6156 stop:6701 length:546 start_codon:yes stop_codon:yes gene_type:complete